jgi:hypothetical protein
MARCYTVGMTNATATNRKTAFLAACAAEGLTSPLKRGQIKAVRIKHNLPMPLWIVQDDSRRLAHGMYSVPELVDYYANMNNLAPTVTTAPATVTLAAESPAMELARRVETLDQEIENLIPRVNSCYVPYGSYKDIERIIKGRRFVPIYISGLSGNGKTTMVEQICANNGREFVRANITKETDEDDLLGGFRLISGESVWVDGPAVVAMKRGAILLLDEVNLNPDKIMCLQPVMEGKPVFLKKINQYVYPAEGFNVLATANGKGQGGEDGYDKFIGTQVMNEAFLERFAMCVEHDYPTRATEKKIVLSYMKREECVDDSFADCLTRWSEAIRKTFNEGACDDIVTTRRLEHIVTMFGIFKDRLNAVEKGVARFSKDTKKSFLDLYTKIDAQVNAPAAAPAPAEGTTTVTDSPTSRVDLDVAYADRFEVKQGGASWDANAKKWYISGAIYNSNPAFWSKWNPKINSDTQYAINA